METKRINITDNFWGLIKNLSADVKLELISKLSNSLKGAKRETRDDSWKELFGAWKSDESAEEMIHSIRADRNTNRQIENWTK